MIVSERIQEETDKRVAHLAHCGPERIYERVRELDREWALDRVVAAHLSVATLIGLTLGRFVDRRFFLMPGIAAAFLMQYALRGWCPPVLLWRRLGFRTWREIEAERCALDRLA